MKIEYEVCDHCGKELNYFGWASKVWKVKKWFNGTGVSDKSYTFCNECSKELSQWIYHTGAANNNMAISSLEVLEKVREEILRNWPEESEGIKQKYVLQILNKHLQEE